MKKMTARYPGKCATCKGRIAPGATITFNGRGTAAHASCSAAAPARSADGDAFEAARGIGSIDFDPAGSGAPGHGPGCYGECDGIYDCS